MLARGSPPQPLRTLLQRQQSPVRVSKYVLEARQVEDFLDRDGLGLSQYSR